jgi:hypothetical protein
LKNASCKYFGYVQIRATIKLVKPAIISDPLYRLTKFIVLSPVCATVGRQRNSAKGRMRGTAGLMSRLHVEILGLASSGVALWSSRAVIHHPPSDPPKSTQFDNVNSTSKTWNKCLSQPCSHTNTLSFQGRKQLKQVRGFMVLKPSSRGTAKVGY